MTALEWFVQEIIDGEMSIDYVIQKAKEMEKQQIIDAWNTRSKIDGVITFTDNRTAEQYYHETFKTK